MIFKKRLNKSLFEWRWKYNFRKREIDRIWDDLTKFIKTEFVKGSWDGIKGKLFTFRSKNDYVKFSECGWNKIDKLCVGGAGGKNGSVEYDGKNLVRMLSMLPLKKSRNVLVREDASGDWK